jgi:hypothetical protein
MWPPPPGVPQHQLTNYNNSHVYSKYQSHSPYAKHSQGISILLDMITAFPTSIKSVKHG